MSSRRLRVEEDIYLLSEPHYLRLWRAQRAALALAAVDPSNGKQSPLPAECISAIAEYISDDLKLILRETDTAGELDFIRRRAAERVA